MNLNIIKQLNPLAFKRIQEGRCPTCDIDIDMDSFKDELSIKEYKISGMCQNCQDKTFGRRR